jgi:hypothetical protein
MGEKVTPLTASAPALTSADVSKIYTQAAQLEMMTLANSTPWLYGALAQLRQLQQDGAVVAGIGDLRIADRTATTARLLFSLINVTDLPMPVVSPVSGGSLSVTWSMGEKEVKFSCFPDGQTLYFQCEDDDVLKDGIVDLVTAESARTALKWMLQP